ncbi:MULTISPECIES: hypothetical protein [Parachlamydia]|jgi:hypothetical protein|uniref:Uncharacterized protein n=1 Tax=Parachlamydia acanthamoebae (strain UV7) TaxID=765952 RepID=F8KZ02_PARAV|nr:hypothetical protein [Parachlamydia acanthamoebae]EFB40922.1 hypothetical protein pah_c178o024 [Parachlamydia acanthamoebae str. Hall's coccus]CCB86125.1 hypothetical protein, putative type III secreted [Parachlamydia acanthamoebae UV-7]
MKTKEELLKRLAYLEFVNDQLTTEVCDLDELLRKVGFPKGVESAKWIGGEMLAHPNDENKEKESP